MGEVLAVHLQITIDHYLVRIVKSSSNDNGSLLVRIGFNKFYMFLSFILFKRPTDHSMLSRTHWGAEAVRCELGTIRSLDCIHIAPAPCAHVG